MIITESYYNDLMMFTRKLYTQIIKTPRYKIDNTLCSFIFIDKPLRIEFARFPSSEIYADAYAYFAPIYSDKRVTVVDTSGKKKRRKQLIAGSIVFNIANIYVNYRTYLKNYNEVAPYIVEIEEDVYGFDEKLSTAKLQDIVDVLVKSHVFVQMLSHEAQHYYGPIVHRRAERTTKYRVQKPVTRERQREINYAFSNPEVDSGIVEAAGAVFGNPIFRHLKKPEQVREFVNACIAVLTREDRWRYYPESIKQKMIKKWHALFLDQTKRAG